MKNLNWCIYTYRHRRAFEYCVNKLIHNPDLKKEMLRRAKVHDMDKMVMYLFLEQKEAQKIHMMHQPHHLENNLPKTYEDLVETVIDYECAPYTKPDKPLNAYDFTNLLMQMKALDEKTGANLISIMEGLGIASSASNQGDEEGHAYMEQFARVTEDMILEEIHTYIDFISHLTSGDSASTTD